MALPSELRIAVVSDLHCHDLPANGTRCSFLLAGAPRGAQNQHPIQSLITLIRAEKLTADILLCPGDLADKTCSKGMMQAWDHLRELKTEMSCRELLSTIGNHDVDSRSQHGKDKFEIPRNLHPEFPVKDTQLSDSFWSRGFYFFFDPFSSTDFLVLNTVIDHHDTDSAKKGTFDDRRIEKLREALAERNSREYFTHPTVHRIAVMHHHPILHSSGSYSSTDSLDFGDQLLTLLAEHDFQLLIHGHRHDPRLTRTHKGGSEQLVFAAGSFSAYLHESGTYTRNLFHLITLQPSQSPHSNLHGTIESWEYNHGVGWSESTTRSAALPHLINLSIPKVDCPSDQVIAACDAAQGQVLLGTELVAKFPELQKLLPSELEKVRSEFQSRGYKLVISSTGQIERCGKIIA